MSAKQTMPAASLVARTMIEDRAIRELCQQISTGQRAEIAQMKRLLER